MHLLYDCDQASKPGCEAFSDSPNRFGVRLDGLRCGNTFVDLQYQANYVSKLLCVGAFFYPKRRFSHRISRILI